VIAQAFRHGLSVEEVAHASKYEPWFLRQIEQLVECEAVIRKDGLPKDAKALLELKKKGFSDDRLGRTRQPVGRRGRQAPPRARRAAGVQAHRHLRRRVRIAHALPLLLLRGRRPSPGAVRGAADRQRKIIILGGGPNRIGQGIEFDYCCVHAVYALREAGYETIMVNCNPETVSTDYDTADRLYFEPLTAEDVIELVEVERRNGELLGLIVQFGGQTPLKLAKPLEAAGIPDPRHLARRDRPRRGPRALPEADPQLKLRQPDNGTATSEAEAIKIAEKIGYPVVIRPSYVLGGRAMQIVYDLDALQRYMRDAVKVSGANPVLIDFLPARRDRGRCRCAGRQGPERVRRRHHGAHRGGRDPFRRFGLLAAALLAAAQDHRRDRAPDRGDGQGAAGRRPDERAVRGEGRRRLRARGQSARQPHRAVRRQGDRPADRQVRRPPDGRRVAEVARHQEDKGKHIAVKEAVFPFARFPGVDVILGPEMRSTGEVMGLDQDFGRAFAKSQLGAGSKVPVDGQVFVSVKDPDKAALVKPVKRLVELGFKVVATGGTADFLAKHGIVSQRVNKVLEGRPHIVDLMKDGKIQLVFNTVDGRLGADRQLHAAPHRPDAQDRLLHHGCRRQGLGRGDRRGAWRGARRGALAILLQGHVLTALSAACGAFATGMGRWALTPLD
jgi:carbamoyl-phosphate synthase large subunit